MGCGPDESWQMNVGVFRKNPPEMNKMAKYTDTVSDTVYPKR